MSESSEYKDPASYPSARAAQEAIEAQCEAKGYTPREAQAEACIQIDKCNAAPKANARITRG